MSSPSIWHQNSWRALRRHPWRVAMGIGLLMLAWRFRMPDIPKQVRVVTVTANLPPGLDLDIQREFRSIQGLVTCRSITAFDGSLISLEWTLHSRLDQQHRHVSVPLAWDERAFCQWTYHNANIRLVESIDNDDDTIHLMPITDRHFEEYGSGNTASRGCTNKVEISCIRCRDYPGSACTRVFRRAGPKCRTGTGRNHFNLEFNVSFATDELLKPEKCRKLYKQYRSFDNWDLDTSLDQFASEPAAVGNGGAQPSDVAPQPNDAGPQPADSQPKGSPDDTPEAATKDAH